MAMKEQEESEILLKELEYYANLIRQHKEKANLLGASSDDVKCIKKRRLMRNYQFEKHIDVSESSAVGTGSFHSGSNHALSQSLVLKALHSDTGSSGERQIVTIPTAEKHGPLAKQGITSVKIPHAKLVACEKKQIADNKIYRSSKYTWSRQMAGQKSTNSAEISSRTSVGPVVCGYHKGLFKKHCEDSQQPAHTQTSKAVLSKNKSKPVNKYKFVRAKKVATLEDSFNKGLNELTRSRTSTPISELRKQSKSELTCVASASTVLKLKPSGGTIKKSRYKLVKSQRGSAQSSHIRSPAGLREAVVTRHKIIKQRLANAVKEPNTTSGAKAASVLFKKGNEVAQMPTPSRKSKYKLVKSGLRNPHINRMKTNQSNILKDRTKLVTQHCLIRRTSSDMSADIQMRNPFAATTKSEFVPLSMTPNQSTLLKTRYKLVKQAIYTANAKTRRYSTDVNISSKHVNNVATRRMVKAKRTKYSIVKNVTGTCNSYPALAKKAKNVSKNKFKFVAAKTRRKRNSVCFQRSKLKLDRRRVIPTRGKQGQYVSLKGQLYLKRGKSLIRIGQMNICKGTRTLQTKMIPGNKSPYKFDRRRKFVRSHRLVSKPEYTAPRTTDKTSTQVIARNVLAKSLATVYQSRFRTDNRVKRTVTKTSKFCLYYIRFGKCSRGDRCPFIHDPEKVAVCSRFLRGKCKIENCPFSHKLSKKKVPVCSYFLKGRCAREDCPYLHVNVGHSAEVCMDFVSGYCDAGEKCKKKHTMNCPVFQKEGACPDGVRCKLRHIKKGMKRTYSKVNLSLQKPAADEPKSKRRKTGEEPLKTDDRHLPLSQRVLPSFISIADDESRNSTAASRKGIPVDDGVKSNPIQIRPVFSQDY